MEHFVPGLVFTCPSLCLAAAELFKPICRTPGGQDAALISRVGEEIWNHTLDILFVSTCPLSNYGAKLIIGFDDPDLDRYTVQHCASLTLMIYTL